MNRTDTRTHLHLQAVRHVDGPLEHGGAEVSVAGRAVAGGEAHVHRPHLRRLKRHFVDFGFRRFLLDDDVVAVNDKLLHLVGQRALHALHAKVLRDTGDQFCDLRVGVAGLDGADGQLRGGVRCGDDVGLLLVRDSRGAAHDARVRHHGNEAVQVAPHVAEGKETP